MPSVPPEMGGILGSKNNVIDEIKFDAEYKKFNGKKGSGQ